VIIVRLIGGLGNQLFQYAIARRMSIERQQPFKLDLTAYETDTLRTYGLRPFNTCQDVATADEIQRAKPSGFLQRLLSSKKWIRERTPYVYDPGVMRARGDVYLEGYWATEAYFKPIESTIRQEFTVTTEPGAENLATARAIAATTSVCLHVRRGDYATDPATQQFHGLSPLSYYEQAVARLTQTVTDPHFFIFSDDPAWVREHLQLTHPATYVTHNRADKDYEDLRLMASCRHHIIANSSFSWWGAWLGQRPIPGPRSPIPDPRSPVPDRQIVIAPAKWLNAPGIDTSGATPPGWIRL
jgi:hypothetical protein